MPKFSKNCNNPFHDDWSDGVDGCSRMVNLRAFGLGELAEAFDKLSKFVANEKTSKKLPTSAKVVFSSASKRGILLGICQNKYLLMQLKRR